MSFRAAKCGSRFLRASSGRIGNLVPDRFRGGRNPMGTVLEGGADGLRVLFDDLAGRVGMSGQRVRHRFSFFGLSGQ
jgi:hypothetical protein